jgi:hypothetical protein
VIHKNLFGEKNGKEKIKTEKNEPQSENNGHHRYFYYPIDGDWVNSLCFYALNPTKTIS